MRHGSETEPEFEQLLIALLKQEQAKGGTRDPLVSNVDTIQLEVLQLQHAGARRDGPNKYLAEAACLGWGRYSGGKCLLLATAGLQEGDEWRLQQVSDAHMAEDDPRLKTPVFTMQLVGHRRVVIGMVTQTPEVKSMRLILSNGESHDSDVSNGSALLAVPFRVEVQSAREGTFEVLDRSGGVVGTESIAVLSSQDNPIA
ncbi:MAG: hypothetical protein ACR2OE_06225 [Thermomicrobiales bacterium]